MLLIKLRRKSLKRKYLKARKKPLQVLVLLQRRKIKKSREVLRKVEVLVVAAEVAEVVIEVLQNKTSSLLHADHQQFPVVRFMLKNNFEICKLFCIHTKRVGYQSAQQF